MHLIPSWAPNLHPMIVHFPIVLVMLAAGSDLIHLFRPFVRTLSGASSILYLLAAVFAGAAFASGRLAESTVFIPGMAHSMIEDHEHWALASTVGLVLVAALRLASRLTKIAETRTGRVLMIVFGLTTAVLVQQTAERGARLVYEQGVGVIPGPIPPAPLPPGGTNLDAPP